MIHMVTLDRDRSHKPVTCHGVYTGTYGDPKQVTEKE